MTWVLAAGVVWFGVAVLVGDLVGRGIRLPDRRAANTGIEGGPPNFVVDADPPVSGPPHRGPTTSTPRPPAAHMPHPRHGLA